MITSITCKLTWGSMGKSFSEQSEKKIERTLKELTGADDVEIIDVSSWDEEEDFDCEQE